MFSAVIYETSGQVTTYDNYVSFIKHIRSLSLVPGSCQVQLTIFEAESPRILIDTADLYIRGAVANEIVALPPNLIAYEVADQTINIPALIHACMNIDHWLNHHEALAAASIKILSFFISEAARFKVIEKVVLDVLNGGETQWSDWAPMLKSWAAISVHETPYNHDSLVVPIPMNSALTFFQGLGVSSFPDFCELAKNYDSDNNSPPFTPPASP